MLYDTICCDDILLHAYWLARANAGAPGVHAVTFAQIEEEGLEAWLAGLREELVSKTYRPNPVRQVMIPKPDGGERPPTGADLYFYETTPRLYGQFLAYMPYRWEIILRESAVFGILGVRTLGYYVDAAISELRLDTAAFLLIGVAVPSMSVDALSRGLRRRLRIDVMQARLSAKSGPSPLMAR